MEIVIILFIVVVIVLLVLGLLLTFRRWQNRYKIQQIEKQREKLFDMTVFNEVEAVEKLPLTAEQEAVFYELKQRWEIVSTLDFGMLETIIMKAESFNARPNKIVAAKEIIASASQKLAEMEKEIFEIRQGLARLIEEEKD